MERYIQVADSNTVNQVAHSGYKEILTKRKKLVKYRQDE